MSRRGRPRKQSGELKKIAVDVDGVLANTQELVLRRLGLAADLEQVTSWDFFERFGERFWTEYERAWQLFDEIRPTDETVREAMDRLFSSGLVVDVVTCRDERLRPYTVSWLARNGIKYHELVLLPYDADKVEVTQYDLYVDDNSILAEKHPDKVVLYDRPWNRGVSNVRRVKVLMDVFNYLKI